MARLKNYFYLFFIVIHWNSFTNEDPSLMDLPNELLQEIGYQVLYREDNELFIENLNAGLKNLHAYSLVNRRLYALVQFLLEGIFFRSYLRSLLIERSFTLHHAMIGACIHNLKQTAQLLLRYKPQPETNPLLFCSSDGKSYLHYAAQFNALSVLSLLLSKDRLLVYAKDKMGNTPLHATIESLSIEAAQVLLDNGANVFAKNDCGLTPLDATRYRKMQREDKRERLIALKKLLTDREQEVNLIRSLGQAIKREIKYALS